MAGGDGDLVPSSRRAGERFRILRFHAEGGLGEVFVALDEELHREVALKEIRPDKRRRPDLRGRFVLEAEITGGLEHPGIVPVYGLGTYADGRPFYAMRFIEGDSLKEAIESLPPGEQPRPDPARRRVPQAAAAGSSTSATRSPTRTAGGCCTATSSRATSCWASTARRWWSTGGWPRRPAAASRRRGRRRRGDAGAALGQRARAETLPACPGHAGRT